MTADPIAAALRVAGILTRLRVPYLLVGSVASSIYGEPRATEDVDIVLDFDMDGADALVRALEGDYYVDAGAVREAVRRRSSFNIIGLGRVQKIVLFLMKDRPFDREEFRRRVEVELVRDPAARAFLAAPEDLLLHKLEWFRQGGEVSDRQWRDVLGIANVQAGRLDREHSKRMGASLGVADLLERVWEEAGSAEGDKGEG